MTKGFIIIGDNLSLDFLNTQIVDEGKPKDLLANFEDFLAWQITTRLLEASEADELSKRWANRRETQELFREIIDFRKMLRKTVDSLIRGKSIPSSALQRINEVLHLGYGYHELVKTKRGFEKRLRTDFQEPKELLLPIAESAADLLSYGNRANLRKCENSQCILYFYDTTKNHRRRWCSMSGCGNRAKAAAFYKRKRNQS